MLQAPLVHLGVLLVTVAGLWIGARLLVDAAVRLARRVGLSELTIGLTVVAAGTSTPELVVTTDAALKGFGEIAVGNVIGSNVYNLAFILGVVSLVRVVPIDRSLVHRDGVALIASTLIGFAVVSDLRVSRAEGVVLLALFALYTGYLIRTGTDPTPPGASPTVPADPPGGLMGRVPLPERGTGRDALSLAAGLGLVLVSGDVMVGTATELARTAGVSDWVIGGTIVAAGTSTPEFAVSLVAIRRGSLGVSVGNVVGSNVFNLLGVLGAAAAIRPLAVGDAVLGSMAWLTAVATVMVAALWTGRALSRAEGGLFALSEVARWTLGLLGPPG
ncbi:sodium:calcium antiporter [Halorarum salinum]|uniref:Sodium:calcium antiporter n=1 Tax=Halorarum salinum TaxID=2743089 RepID=A0A7D5LAY3_9EURY|nr:sodium:calcium antiporter [Halobaculum salinum]QLG62372.1 sodium:calcium antiporter [Halobaculum salinum]